MLDKSEYNKLLSPLVPDLPVAKFAVLMLDISLYANGSLPDGNPGISPAAIAVLKLDKFFFTVNVARLILPVSVILLRFLSIRVLI